MRLTRTSTTRAPAAALSGLFAALTAIGCGHAEPVLRGPVGHTEAAPRTSPPAEFEDADPAAFALFAAPLAEHGTWTEDPVLGIVWRPAQEEVGDGFIPYATHGRWAHRRVSARDPEEGARVVDELVWVSDLPWGWITFHYGRWSLSPRGWAWIPGRRYSGAWVDWRVEDGRRPEHVGWGPTPPAHVWRAIALRTSRAGGRVVRVPWAPGSVVPVTVTRGAYATPYVYARVVELFALDLRERLLPAAEAYAFAHATTPVDGAPRIERIGLEPDDTPSVPSADLGLQRAWSLATPASASAMGAGDELGPPPRLRTFVAGHQAYYAR